MVACSGSVAPAPPPVASRTAEDSRHRSAQDPDPAPVESEPPDTASASTRPCPEGAALVEGGVPSAEVLKIFDRFYAAQPQDARLAYREGIADFCMDLTEVTFGQMLECLDAQACGARRFAGNDETVSWCPKDGSACQGVQYPVGARYPRPSELDKGAVDPAAYCAFRGGRLPTAHEWRWAALGGNEARKYPWGDAAPTVEHLNIADGTYSEYLCEHSESCKPGTQSSAFSALPGHDGFVGAAPVGRFPKGAGRWGHLDLLGNKPETVVYSDVEPGRYTYCGGHAATDRLEELDLRAGDLCSGDAGALRCVYDPRK